MKIAVTDQETLSAELGKLIRNQTTDVIAADGGHTKYFLLPVGFKDYSVLVFRSAYVGDDDYGLDLWSDNYPMYQVMCFYKSGNNTAYVPESKKDQEDLFESEGFRVVSLTEVRTDARRILKEQLAEVLGELDDELIASGVLDKFQASLDKNINLDIGKFNIEALEKDCLPYFENYGRITKQIEQAFNEMDDFDDENYVIKQSTLHRLRSYGRDMFDALNFHSNIVFKFLEDYPEMIAASVQGMKDGVERDNTKQELLKRHLLQLLILKMRSADEHSSFAHFKRLYAALHTDSSSNVMVKYNLSSHADIITSHLETSVIIDFDYNNLMNSTIASWFFNYSRATERQRTAIDNAFPHRGLPLTAIDSVSYKRTNLYQR